MRGLRRIKARRTEEPIENQGTHDTRSDEELLASWFRGEAAAFLAFHGRHRGRVVNWLRSRGMPPAEADDVTQEAFLKLHANIGSWDPSRAALPWFFAIVRNCWLDALRRAKRQRLRTERYAGDSALVGVGAASHDAKAGSSIGPDVDSAWARESGAELALREALDCLPADQKALLTARLSEEVPYATLATRFGKSEPALRKSFERALKSLRARIAPTRREG